MTDQLRSFWYQQQGLYEPVETASQALQRSGWARSVGGSNPYITLFTRARCSRADAEGARADHKIQELPSARGCTHYIPDSDYALALKVGQGTSEVAAMRTAKKWLGFTEADLDALCEQILRTLQGGAASVRKLKESLGDRVVNFGDEGKKRGQTTSLSLGLGWLQAHGHIRRIPINGRLDTETYSYEIWNPNPLDGFGLSRDEALVDLARKYFGWIGPAKASHFQWFAGLGVGVCKQTLAQLDLVELKDGYLISHRDHDSFQKHRAPEDPHYSLVTCIDSILLHRRDVRALLAEDDSQRPIWNGGGLHDLASHAILDRGRIVGLWECDPEREEIVTNLFVEINSELQRAIERTAEFVRSELGDVRSFSLDSPKIRQGRIEALRQK